MAEPAKSKLSSILDIFVQWDQDGKGVIPRNQLEMVLRSAMPDIDDSEVSALLDGVDKGGSINYREFCEWLSGGSGEAPNAGGSQVSSEKRGSLRTFRSRRFSALDVELERPLDASDVSGSLEAAVAEVKRLRALLGSLRNNTASESETRLRVIHVNDVYTLENFPYLKGCIDAHRKGCRNVLVTLAGDFLGPSLLSSLDQGVGMVDCLNRVGVNVVCFGNHESDVPYEALSYRIDEFHGIWLNSNMPGFKPQLPAYHVQYLTGEDGKTCARKIGLIGLLIGGGKFGATYRDDALGGAAKSIIPVMDAHEKVCEDLMDAHPELDCIIPLTHQDQAEDEELAASGAYPIILAGHDHDVTSKEIDGVRVLKAGQDAHNAAIVDFVWKKGQANGEMPEVTTHFVRVMDYPADPEVEATVARWMAPVRELEVATVAQLTPKLLEKVPEGKLSSKDARFGPCSMASFLGEAIRICEKTDLVLINSGAVRGDKVYKDELTYADLKSECPFPSENVVAKISGKTIIDAVKQSRELWQQPGGPYEASKALQVDSSSKCILKDGSWEVTIINDKPIVLDKLYSVVCDTYDLLKNPHLNSWCKEHPEYIPPADAGRPVLPILVEYFCNEMWRTIIDVNGDGDIQEEEIDALFREIDGNQDGLLSVEEVSYALKKQLGEGGSAIIAKQMVAIADKDHSGTISREELTALIQMRLTTATLTPNFTASPRPGTKGGSRTVSNQNPTPR